MKQLTAQEIVDCKFNEFDFVTWYNFRLEMLNPKPKIKYWGRSYTQLNSGGKTKWK